MNPALAVEPESEETAHAQWEKLLQQIRALVRAEHPRIVSLLVVATLDTDEHVCGHAEVLTKVDDPDLVRAEVAIMAMQAKDELEGWVKHVEGQQETRH